MQNSSLLSLCEQTLATTQVGRPWEYVHGLKCISVGFLYTSQIALWHWELDLGIRLYMYPMNATTSYEWEKQTKNKQAKKHFIFTAFKEDSKLWLLQTELVAMK